MSDTQRLHPCIDLKCAHCRTTAAQIINGVLVIQSRHNGVQHTNVISLQLLKELLTGNRSSCETAREIETAPQ